jgi:hypothetical protein
MKNAGTWPAFFIVGVPTGIRRYPRDLIHDAIPPRKAITNNRFINVLNAIGWQGASIHCFRLATPLSPIASRAPAVRRSVCYLSPGAESLR